MATFASGAAYISNIFSKNKIPIILNLQEGDSEEHFGKRWFGLIDLSWKMALKRTSYLTVLSQFLKDRAERFGYKGAIKIIPNGVDINRFDLKDWSVENKREIRKKLNLIEDDIVLITSSRLVVKNGVGDVISSLQYLDKNIKFLICGDGDLKQELENLAKKLNVSERVIFAGNVSHEDLPKYLKACDIFIRPSLSEGMGNSFIEAMAAKLPVIATPVGGIVDFLRDSPSTPLMARTGYFCEPNNPESISKTVIRVLEDKDKENILENAHKLAKEKYNWDKIALEMKEVFNF